VAARLITPALAASLALMPGPAIARARMPWEAYPWRRLVASVVLAVLGGGAPFLCFSILARRFDERVASIRDGERVVLGFLAFAGGAGFLMMAWRCLR
jgi:hypothetical protein